MWLVYITLVIVTFWCIRDSYSGKVKVSTHSVKRKNFAKKVETQMQTIVKKIGIKQNKHLKRNEWDIAHMIPWMHIKNQVDSLDKTKLPQMKKYIEIISEVDTEAKFYTLLNQKEKDDLKNLAEDQKRKALEIYDNLEKEYTKTNPDVFKLKQDLAKSLNNNVGNLRPGERSKNRSMGSTANQIDNNLNNAGKLTTKSQNVNKMYREIKGDQDSDMCKRRRRRRDITCNSRKLVTGDANQKNRDTKLERDSDSTNSRHASSNGGKKSNPIKMIKRLGKVLNVIGNFMGAFGAVWDIVSILLPQQESAEMKFMRQNFDEMSGRFEEILSKFDESDEYNKHLSIYNRFIRAKNKIDTVERSLVRFSKQAKEVTGDKNRLQIWNHFITVFETNNIETEIVVLKNMFLEKDGANYIQSVERLYKCDWLKIAPILFYIVDTYSRAIVTIGVYYRLKQLPYRPEIHYRSTYDMTAKIFYSFDRCMSRRDEVAGQLIQSITKWNSQDSVQQLATLVQTKLEDSLGFWNWAVIAYDVLAEENDGKVFTRGNVITHAKVLVRDDKERRRYVIAMPIGSGVAVDRSNWIKNSCRVHISKRTLVMSKHILTMRVHPFAVVGPVTHKKCPGSMTTVLFTSKPLSNPCSSNSCSNGGKCKWVLLSDYFFCHCSYGYSGEHCEKDILKLIGENAEMFMVDIEKSLVPNTVDVYYDSMEKFETIIKSLATVGKSLNDTKIEILRSQKIGVEKLKSTIETLSRRMRIRSSQLDARLGYQIDHLKNINQNTRQQILKEMISLSRDMKTTVVGEEEITRELVKSATFLVRGDIKRALDTMLSQIRVESKQNLLQQKKLVQEIRKIGIELDDLKWYSIFGESLVDIAFIYEIYNEYTSKNITTSTTAKFLREMNLNLAKSFKRYQWDLKNILGLYTNIILPINEDLFQVLKSHWQENIFKRLPMNEERYRKYFRKVIEVRNKLIQDVKLMWIIELKYTLLITKSATFTEIHYLRSPLDILIDQTRTMLTFTQHITRSSCPVLHGENITNPLPVQFSYASMAWQIQCSDGYIAFPTEVICSNVNGVLKWSHTPVCHKVVERGKVMCQSQGESTTCQLKCGLATLSRIGVSSTTCSGMPCVSLLKYGVCKPCPLGYFRLKREIACKPCPPGQYSISLDSSKCLHCPAGTYSDTNGASSCKNCPRGYYQNTIGQDRCNPCSVGTYAKHKGMKVCLDCKAGSFAATVGRDRCSPCKAGTYTPSLRSSKCQPCPPGNYIDSQFSPTCLQCQKGHYASESGSISCIPCPAGEYSQVTGEIICSICPKGEFSQSGQATCSKCLPGEFASSTGSSICSKCKPGTYSDKNGAELCSNCLSGTSVSSYGATECVPCQPGYYSSSKGATVCTACQPGTFEELYKSSECTLCHPGSATLIPASPSCTECLPGTYQSSPGAQRCKKCLLGTYSSTKGTKLCSQCQPGSIASNPGSKSCSKCDKGYTSNKSFTTCNRCPIGTEAKLEGSARCKMCSPGTYADLKGTTECKMCSPGTYADLKGTTECSQCPKGYYSSQTGSASCSPCYPNTYANIKGSVSCNHCPDRFKAHSEGSKRCEILDFSSTSTITPNKYGKKGDWSSWDWDPKCKPNGFDQRYRYTSDHMGLVDIKLICRVKNNRYGSDWMWLGIKYCHSGKYIVGFVWSVGDSSVGALFIKFLCAEPISHSGSHWIYQTRTQDMRDEHLSWSTKEQCPRGTVICGWRYRYHFRDWIFNSWNKSGINDVYFKCCAFQQYYP